MGGFCCRVGSSLKLVVISNFFWATNKRVRGCLRSAAPRLDRHSSTGSINSGLRFEAPRVGWEVQGSWHSVSPHKA